MKLGKTFTVTKQPWGLFARNGHRVLCSDGKIRACAMAQTADTFFSVPASIRIKGKTVTGYVTTENEWERETGETFEAYAFRQHNGQEEFGLPPWPTYVDGNKLLQLVKLAHA